MIILRNGISYFFKLSRLGFALILIFTLMPLPSVEAARPLYCTVGGHVKAWTQIARVAMRALAQCDTLLEQIIELNYGELLPSQSV